MPAEEVSIFKNFIYPQTLAKGIKAARTLAGSATKRSLALYISTRDGALLQYVSTFASKEQKFLAHLPEGEGGGCRFCATCWEAFIKARPMCVSLPLRGVERAAHQ